VKNEKLLLPTAERHKELFYSNSKFQVCVQLWTFVITVMELCYNAREFRVQVNCYQLFRSTVYCRICSSRPIVSKFSCEQ